MIRSLPGPAKAILAGGLLLACGVGAPRAEPAPVRATPAASPVPPVKHPAARSRSPAGGAPSARPSASRRAVARRLPGPLATIDAANAQARDWPTPSAYVNSALYYDFEPGRLYTIHTSPRFLTTIQLKPGEKLISKAAGDTVRWVLGETQAGSGGTAQVTIFVKPIRPDLRTNIVLTTDQRTYLIDAASSASRAYTSVLSWNYPQDQARALAAERQRAAAADLARAASSVQDGVPIERLNFGYAITPIKSRPPPWQPVRVFDDGSKTYVEFPVDLASSQAPPLFLLGADGQAELVNYRVRGRYYVVDRLIDAAELRLGDKRQTVVRLTRIEARG